MKELIVPLAVLTAAMSVAASEVLPGQRLALTIYNGGFGLVRDVRTIAFDEGTSYVRFTDVASSILTETVMFKPQQQEVTAGNRIRIYEQNYQNNLASRLALLKKYLEKNISVDVIMGQQAHNRKGRLLAFQQAILLQTLKSVSIFPKVNAIMVDSYLAEGLLLRPTLVWKVHSPKSSSTACEVSYRAEGFSWKSDYNLVLNEDETEAELTGWVTIDNRSGKRYANTSLKLIAGDVHTVEPKPLRFKSIRRKFGMFSMSMRQQKKGFTEKSFGDYHMYTLGRRVDINESSQKQIEFIETARSVSVDKYYTFTINVGRQVRQKVEIASKIRFTNEKANKLGMPLPKGTIRVFKHDTNDGSLEFLGEDNIDHTPRDQNVTIKTGIAFDVVATMRLKSRNFTRNGYDAVKRLEVKNRGDIPRQFRIELNNYYGENLQLAQPQSRTLYWHREGSSKFSLQFSVAGGKMKAVQWLQSVRK